MARDDKKGNPAENTPKADTIYGLSIDKHTIVTGSQLNSSSSKGKENHVSRTVGRVHMRIVGSPYTITATVSALGTVPVGPDGKPNLKGTVTSNGLKVSYGWSGLRRALMPDSETEYRTACESLLTAWRTWFAGLSDEAKRQASEKEGRAQAAPVASDLSDAERGLFA